MRALLLFVALATAASAQTSEIEALDREIETLDREIAQLDGEIRDVQAEVGRYGSRSRSLSERRREYQDRVADYRGRTYALQGRAAEVRDLYDDLVRYGGSDADLRAYDDARYSLELEAERLQDEAAELQRLADDISQSGRASADRVDRVAVRGRSGPCDDPAPLGAAPRARGAEATPRPTGGTQRGARPTRVTVPAISYSPAWTASAARFSG